MERKRYNIGVYKIPSGDRDIAHKFITAEDDRGFFDIIGADSPDECNDFPIGAMCTYRLELTEEEADEFRKAKNCRYVEEDTIKPKATTVGLMNTAFPSADVLKFLEADFNRNDLWHGRDVPIAIIDGGTTAGSRAAADITLLARMNFSAAPPSGQEVHDDHGDNCLAAIPYGGKFYDVLAQTGSGMSTSAFCAGARWAADQGAKIVLISAASTVVGSTPSTVSQAETDMGKYLNDRAVILVAPAGNNSATVVSMPARLSITYAHAHSVGGWAMADTGSGAISTTSNRETAMTGVAPGENNVTYTLNGATELNTGTSIAAAHAVNMMARALTGGRFTTTQVSAAAKANMRSMGVAASIQGGGAYSLLKTLQGLGAMTGTTHNAGGPYTNLSPNPACATVSTGWTAGGTGGRVTSLDVVKFERDTGFSSTVNILTPKAAGASGNSYTHSVALSCDTAATVNVSIRWFGSTGTLLSTTNARDITWDAGGVSRVLVTGTAPASTSTHAMYITTTAGTLTATSHIAELGATGHPFFDGFTINGNWTGSPGLSTSTLAFAVPPQTLRYNLVSNPSFEVDLTGWTLTNVRSGVTATALARQASVTTPFTTNYAFVNTNNGGSTSSTTPDWVLNGPDVTVNSGYTFLLSAHIKHQVANSKVRWVMDWYDSSGNLLSTTTASSFTNVFAQEWTRAWTTMVCPLNAVVGKPKLEYWGGSLDTTARTVRVDGVHIERSNQLVRYFDGTELNATWTGTAGKSTSYLGIDESVPPPPTVATEIVGTSLNGSSAATSFNITVPTGVTTSFTGLILIASGTSAANVFTLTKSGGGGTFTKVEEINAQNMRVSVWTCTGLVAANTINIALSISDAITVVHYYQDGWDYEDIASAIRSASSTSSVTGAVTAGNGQRVFILGAERTTAANVAPTVTASGGETVTQKVYFEGTGSAQSSAYIGYFDANAAASRTATLTYTTSSANGYAATLLTSATGTGGGGTGGGGGGAVVVVKPGVLHNIGKASGKNHFNLGVGYTSGHVDKTENEIESGFEIPDNSAGPAYFTKADGTAVVMSVPLNGGKTSANTAYPRTEYRELAAGGTGDSSTTKASWDGSTGDHYISGRTRVVKIQPNKPEVVIAQVHGPDDDTAKFKWRGTGTSATMVATYDDDDYGTVASGLSVGTEYAWKLRMVDGNIEFYWVDMTTPKIKITDATLASSGQYFKAGAYVQSNTSYDSVSSGPCIIEMRDFVCWHTGYPPPSSTITGAPTVGAGDDVSVHGEHHVRPVCYGKLERVDDFFPAMEDPVRYRIGNRLGHRCVVGVDTERHRYLCAPVLGNQLHRHRHRRCDGHCRRPSRGPASRRRRRWYWCVAVLKGVPGRHRLPGDR